MEDIGIDDLGHEHTIALDEDLFPESLTNFSPVFPDENVSSETLLNCEQRVTGDIDAGLEAGDTMKCEPQAGHEDYFDDLYPEVTLNEELETSSKADSLKCKNGKDEVERQVDSSNADMRLGFLINSKIPELLLKSLINQLKNILTPDEVCRSLTCFVPVIPLQDPDIENIQQLLKRRSNLYKKIIKRKSTQTVNAKSVHHISTRNVVSEIQKVLLTELTENRKPSRGRPRTKQSPTKSLEGTDTKERKNKPLSCLKCSREFRTELAFQNHQKPFDQDMKTHCTTCDTNLEHPNCLRYHRRKVHGENEDVNLRTNVRGQSSSRVCEVCNKSFTRIAGLVYHRRRSHNLGKSVERKYECAQCHKSFFQRSHLLSHKKGHIRNRELGKEDLVSDDSDFGEEKRSPACDVCGKLFTRVSGLIYHQRQVHGIGGLIERKFECNKCDKSFLKKSHLILHDQSHTGERLFPCRFCERSFGGRSGRRLHEEKVHGENGNGLSHEEIKKIRANGTLKFETGFETNPGEGVEKSQKSQNVKPNPNDSREYTCSYCPKTFPRPSAKRVHERRHTGEKPFLCVVCGNTYKSSVALREHEKTAHTHTLDLLCTLCGAAFGRQMSLKYHILSRHSDKKFTCDKEGCGRAFVQRAKLVRHQRIHNLGLHQCNICNRAVESDEHLKRHMLIHEMKKMKEDGVPGVVIPRNPINRKKSLPKGRKQRKTPAPVRKLQCEYCEKRFPYQNELDKHTKAVHLNEREFKCPEAGCSRAYISHYKLQNHLRKAHGHVIENNLLADIECDECGKVVQGVARLAIHKKCRHSGVNSKPSKAPQTLNGMATVSRRSRSHGAVEVLVQPGVISGMPISPNNKSMTAVVSSTSTISYSESHITTIPAQSAQRTQRNSVGGGVPQPQHSTVQIQGLRSMIYNGAHDQISFVNFASGYSTALPPPSFPYSSIPLATSYFQHQDLVSDCQNGSNVWQAHQNPLSHRSLQQPLYQPLIQSTTQSRQLETVTVPVRENYLSSDYSDLIRIPPQEETQYQPDSDTSATSNEEEEEQETMEPEEDVQPVRKRGRPRKDLSSVPPPHTAAIEQSTQQEGPTTHVKKRRKRLAKKELPCPTCNKVFGTNQHLRTHQQIHERKEPKSADEFKCDVCGKTFSRPYYLTVHSVIHDPSLKPFKCSETGCEEAFRAPAEFRKHKIVHSIKTERRYRCKICKQEKATSGELHAHVIADHADKMHVCNHPGCSFMCPTASRLRRHSEQHQDKGERLRPYKCPFCECSYIRGDNLQQHLDTSHDGAASAVTNPSSTTFTCHICFKQFEFEWKVKSHIRKTHGRNRKSKYLPRTKPLFYYCEDCDWSFSNAGSLRRHMKGTHKGDPIPCLKQPCDKKYFYVNKLENHLKTQHDNVTKDDMDKLVELRLTFPSEPNITDNVGKRSKRRGLSLNQGDLFFEEDFEDDVLEEDESELEFHLPTAQVKAKGRQSIRSEKPRYDDSETSTSDDDS